jgi:hypothetical protein
MSGPFLVVLKTTPRVEAPSFGDPASSFANSSSPPPDHERELKICMSIFLTGSVHYNSDGCYSLHALDQYVLDSRICDST